MYTSSQLFIQHGSILSWNCAVHSIQTARTYSKREKDADSDRNAIVFQMRKGEKTSIFPTQAAREKKADYIETTQKEHAARKS